MSGVQAPVQQKSQSYVPQGQDPVINKYAPPRA